MGLFLDQNGLLDCWNTVPRAIDTFWYIKRVLEGLDGSKFESYQTAVVSGLVQYSLVLGFKGEDAVEQLVDIFYQLFYEEVYGDSG
ncbi:hypothetical protein JTE90_025120 [Oedothorax gibbosus]|nr:hypothetical protein JTE90_025120 [Oedothorax gibbosus]